MPDFDFALYFQYQSAMELRESDPDEALRRLNKIRDEAIDKQNDEWRLIAEHWRTQIYMNWKKDFITANRLAVEATVEARQEKYRQYQEYVCVHNDLLLVYKGIDPVGYAKEIKEAIDLTIGLTTPDMSCHYCMHRDIIDHHIHIGEEDIAREKNDEFFAMTQNQPHYRLQSLDHYCYFMFDSQNWSDLRDVTQAGTQLAGELKDESAWIDFKCYEMIALFHLEKPELAQKVHDIVQYRVGTLKMVQGYNYYYLTCIYQELQGNLADAIRIIKEYIQTLKGSGRPYWESKAQLELIRLLKKNQDDYQDAIQEFHQITANLKNTTQFDEKLAIILDD
ncbi:MAG: hypothetical protein Phog2KO_36750 [Phototrophicaceae bacterium]